MAAPISSKLKNPSVRPDIAQGLDRSRDLAIQAITAATPVSGQTMQPAVDQAMSMAPTMAANAVQQTAEARQAGVQQAGAIADTQQAMSQATQAQAAGERQLSLQEQQMENEAKLSQLGMDIRSEIYDSRMKFESDEIGRGTLQDSQLLDFAVSQAKSQEELKDYAQALDQATQKEIAFLEQAWKRLEQTLKLEAEGKIQQLDQDTNMRIQQAIAAAKEAQQKKQAKANARNAMITGALTVVGGVAGGMVSGGNPAVIGLGMQAGQGAGGLAAGATAK